MGWYRVVVLVVGSLLSAQFAHPAFAQDCSSSGAKNPVQVIGDAVAGASAQVKPKAKSWIAKNGAAISRSFSKSCTAAQKAAVKDKPFTAKEKALINQVMAKVKGFLKCPNHPFKGMARVNGILGSNCKLPGTNMGRFDEKTPGNPKGTDVLVITDLANNPQSKSNTPDQEFKLTVAHEISHSFDTFDPRKCSEHGTEFKNPLMKEFMKVAGWDPTGTAKVEQKGNRAVTKYANSNPWEDLAETFSYYIVKPQVLKKMSPARYAFMEKFAKAMGVGTSPVATK